MPQIIQVELAHCSVLTASCSALARRLGRRPRNSRRLCLEYHDRLLNSSCILHAFLAHPPSPALHSRLGLESPQNRKSFSPNNDLSRYQRQQYGRRQISLVPLCNSGMRSAAWSISRPRGRENGNMGIWRVRGVCMGRRFSRGGEQRADGI